MASQPIEEKAEVVNSLPACAVCGSTERRTAHLNKPKYPVDVFAAMTLEYADRWPGCMVENKVGGWRLIGTLVCDHEDTGGDRK